jgi:membrane-bound metal-dependent hydrolase YbcI (DUF457 family)
MYFLFHLATGFLIGLILTDLLHDGRWLIPSGIGAVLPDLIDKPVGYLLLEGYVEYGRILFHTFLAFSLVLAAGIVLWKFRQTPGALALAAGIFSHQVFDSMWNETANWFFPFLGAPALTQNIPPGYVFLLLRDDFLNPSEWLMAGLLVIGYLLWRQRDRVVAEAQEQGRGLGSILEFGGIILWMISGMVFSYGLTGKLHLSFGQFWLANYSLLSLFCALAAFLFWRWGTALGRDRPAMQP